MGHWEYTREVLVMRPTPSAYPGVQSDGFLKNESVLKPAPKGPTQPRGTTKNYLRSFNFLVTEK